MSVGILSSDENVEYKYEYGFKGWFFKKSPITIYDNTKMKLMKM